MSEQNTTDQWLPSGNRNSFVLSAQPWAGGASDVGLKHFPNQDAVALAADTDSNSGRVAVVAVSDGVSTSTGSEHASLIAAETACSLLAGALASAEGEIDLGALVEDAFAAAQSAITDAADPDELPGAWSATMIVALVASGTIVVGNLGDSRAYWFPDSGEPLRLSVDDSMAQARIELGVDPEVAESGPAAHAITKWLGVGAPPATPAITSLTPDGPGWLCVCSDGLWNYASDPAALAEQVASAVRPTEDAWRIAGRLVDWANEQGGRDNIAVALVRLD